MFHKITEMDRRKEILITNDDGIDSKGIKLLAEIMKKYGHVTVVAPAEAQSGKSAGLSLHIPLYLKKTYEDKDVTYFSFTGTPVDCVKIAMNECYDKEHRPDILMSGINHGSNCSVAALYSGTLGACVEGTLYGVPSMGFSITTHEKDPDFGPILKYGDGIIEKFLNYRLDKNVYLNVNFPAVKAEEVKGIKLGRRGEGRWVREFDTFTNENGEKYFVMAGHFEDNESDDRGDHIITGNNYISIVPHTIDNTDYAELERMEKFWKF